MHEVWHLRRHSTCIVTCVSTTLVDAAHPYVVCMYNIRVAHAQHTHTLTHVCRQSVARRRQSSTRVFVCRRTVDTPHGYTVLPNGRAIFFPSFGGLQRMRAATMYVGLSAGRLEQ
jgi:hypothetical protein